MSPSTKTAPDGEPVTFCLACAQSRAVRVGVSAGHPVCLALVAIGFRSVEEVVAGLCKTHREDYEHEKRQLATAVRSDKARAPS